MSVALGSRVPWVDSQFQDRKTALDPTTGHVALTAEERLAIEAQLERLLASSFFSHSRRFPAFLRYVVEKTLDADAENLK